MNWRKISFWSLLTLVLQPLWGQPVQHRGTLTPPANLKVNHMLLKMEIPMGETFVRASDHQGASVYQVSSPGAEMHHQVDSREDGNGTYICSVKLNPPKQEQKGKMGANLRMAEQLTTINTYADPLAYTTAFCPDPSMNTDLFVDLGVGASRLDLSGLKLHNVTINSAFADVLVHYDTPNQDEMTQFSIHAANANVVLKNLEQARSRQVTVHNDMGNTKMIIGKGYLPGGEISIRSGVGGFTLVLDGEQAAELTLNTGFFSEVEIPEDFKEISKGKFINKAVQDSPQDMVKINCEVDFGKIVVIER
jgi:hypothetical protein